MKATTPIIVITGPTASGKTALAIDVAKKIGAEIICADSRIVYKGLDIVSAKPTEAEKDGVVHHLIDIKSVESGIYSAGDFAKDAKEIIKKSNCPIIVQGGTWFYIKTLLDNKELIEFGKNEEFRESCKNYSNDELYEMLIKKDEKRAKLIHKNNRDKVIRSLEIIEAIKTNISDYERKDNENYEAVWFMKEFSREILYERINLRTDEMIKAGLYEEWQKISEKYPDNEILFNTIGYREFYDLKSGIYDSFDVAVDKIKQHTRNFAKRQLTWFRSNQDKIKTVNSAEDILNLL